LYFSILISVHNKEEPLHLLNALDSVAMNTCSPSEIVLVWDGSPAKALEEVANSFCSVLPIRTITIIKSNGLGPALAAGLEQCSNEWIARFDSDDICSPDRFEKQLKYISDNPDVDAFSATLVEFTRTPEDNDLRRKCVPLHHDEIVRYARWRNPLNHPAAMFRRSVALKAGSYRNEPSFEDYSLWLRMIQAGARLGNMKYPVVFARSGKAMQSRRGGIRYALREISFLRNMRSSGILHRRDFYASILLKTPLRLLPASMRHLLYNAALRKLSATRLTIKTNSSPRGAQ